jgi:hypothetical protein
VQAWLDLHGAGLNRGSWQKILPETAENAG